MKLLIISTLTKTLQDQFYAPVESHVRHVGNELAQRGHDVWVAALKGTQPEQFKVVEVDSNDEQKAFEVYKEMLKQFEAVMDFSSLKYTYVYKHDENPELKLIGPCYPYQALGYQTAPPIPFPCMTATSDAMAQAMSAKLGCAFRVVYYFPTPPPPEFSPGERGDRLLFLGRFEKGKGAQEAVDLARQLRIGLDLAGEDVLISDQRFTVLLLQKADGRLIRVYGRVNETMKHELLAKARAVVLPYLEDSMAWTCQPILEAFQHGTPVITMNKGAVGEIMKHPLSGFICETLSELPEVIKHLEETKPEACIETAKLFSLENAVNLYQSLLKQVLDGEEW